ncbi:hypothetical protein CC1G_14887 [Coprinopsis cinerea okayama7|uniref:Uncharacterized protein n=1 Tax=Coprinopsis cinerea (strain Okayama-7 / 130 / ATCC MYA-4618 / FGSC 9003) TaxID=240176 RepID=D6RNK0_COPC7|nr:hypothetical protein CC1G_14887 [Coprinopsis cinerea okayama7\|eukprot:XP_002910910.1 hypothetical protein CC1G_14887 [Coprinopsis cinerea okayama7\
MDSFTTINIPTNFETGGGGGNVHRRVYERCGNRCKPPVLHPSTPRKTPPPGLVPIRQSREVNRQTVIVIVSEGHGSPMAHSGLTLTHTHQNPYP